MDSNYRFAPKKRASSKNQTPIKALVGNHRTNMTLLMLEGYLICELQATTSTLTNLFPYSLGFRREGGEREGKEDEEVSLGSFAN